MTVHSAPQNSTKNVPIVAEGDGWPMARGGFSGIGIRKNSILTPLEFKEIY
jgi:hypothetical protein